MKYILYKEKLIIKILILFLFLFRLYNNECLTHSFPDLNYPKVFTLENGYQLIVTTKGIYSFNPTLDVIVYSYNFTDEQKMTDINYIDNNIDEKIDNINQVEISQFTDEEGKKYAICFAKNYLYLLNKKGKLLYNELISDLNTDYSISLIAYKYSDNNYYFIIAFNCYSSEDSKNILQLRYYKININNNNPNNKYEIQLNCSTNFL